MRSSRVRSFVGWVSLGLGVLAACGGPMAQGAGVGGGRGSDGPTPVIPFRNASDPQARVFDGALYLYTSEDLGTAGTASNPYPMSATYAYRLAAGKNPGTPADWTDLGAVLRESQYTWVPGGADHLWAPDCTRRGKTYYLYVPDVTDKANALSSKIGVSTGPSPAGPFTPRGTLAINGYASDPGVFVDPKGGAAYMVFADGDYSNCGGLSIVPLGADMMTLAGTPRAIAISGLPTAGGACAGKGRPYLEGASLDWFGADGKNQYFLTFAMKPDTDNEVIAYATAASPLGPFQYRGVIMRGSSTEWTNQASIVKWGSGYVFFHHDGPRGTHARKVYAECLTFRPDGTIEPITRTAGGAGGCWKP